MSSLYLAAHPERNVAGLVLHMACHCDYRNWDDKRYRFKMIFTLYPLVAQLWGYFPGRRLGFARREARAFMRDWGYSGRKGKYHPHGILTDYDSLGDGLQIPILAFSLEGDWLAPRKGLEHLYGLFPNAPVRHLHLEPEGHGPKPLSHFNWVYQPGVFIEELQASWENWTHFQERRLPQKVAAAIELV